jgi:hypothetical protein
MREEGWGMVRWVWDELAALAALAARWARALEHRAP